MIHQIERVAIDAETWAIKAATKALEDFGKLLIILLQKMQKDMPKYGASLARFKGKNGLHNIHILPSMDNVAYSKVRKFCRTNGINYFCLKTGSNLKEKVGISVAECDYQLLKPLLKEVGILENKQKAFAR